MWATYLFRNLKDSLGGITSYKATDNDEIERHIEEIGDVSYTAESDEDGFKTSTVFESFHYQARFPISSEALLSDLSYMRLKRSIIPSLPMDTIAINVVYPVPLLAYGRLLELLSLSMCVCTYVYICMYKYVCIYI